MMVPQFDYSFTCGWTFPLFLVFVDLKKAAINIHSSLYDYMLSFLFSKYKGAERLAHMVVYV